jgi:cell division protease FtsH
LPRGAVLFFVLLLVFLAIASVLSSANPQKQDLSFQEFESKWDPTKKAYIGFEKGELRDDTILLKPVPAPEAKKDVAAKAPSDEKDKPATKNAEPAAGKVDLWYRVKVPPNAVDSEFLRRLATIPSFTVYRSNQLLNEFIAYSLVPVLIFVLAFYFLVIRPLRSQGGPGNVLSFGRSRPKLIAKDHTSVKFEDVAGVEEAKEEVAEVIEFLKNPQKFHHLGGRIPRGLLFVGPPGTGKTLLAKAIAGEADVPFFSISGSDFVEMFVGVGASRVRDLFRQAKESAPCIIFLDEVDAVGRRRGSGMGGGHDEREQTLNAILVEMDGFDTNQQVIVIAATNRPDVLDPALLRPGRFDREIVINLPDLKGRYQILKVHARHIKLSDKVDLMKIARGTPMFSGADLEAIINEAAIRASMAGKQFVEEDDLEEARDKIRFGREKKSRVMDEHDREVTAYHEAGHAMVTRLCPDVEPLHKVTIIPRGMSLGSTMMLPIKDRYTVTKRNMLGELKVLFGGRIAEEVFCGDISSGASSDIERASDIARRMVCDYGMSEELGPIRYAQKEQHLYLGGEMNTPREFSEATAEKIDAAVRKIIDQCYQEASELVRSHSDDVRLVAQALLRHETLSAAEIEKILEAKDVEVIGRPSRNGAPATLEEVVEKVSETPS